MSARRILVTLALAGKNGGHGPEVQRAIGSPSDEVEHLVLAQIGQVAHREPHARQVLHHLTWHKLPLGIDLKASGVGLGHSGDPPVLAHVGHVGRQPQTWKVGWHALP